MDQFRAAQRKKRTRIAIQTVNTAIRSNGDLPRRGNAVAFLAPLIYQKSIFLDARTDS
jgi:hypothetical protein